MSKFVIIILALVPILAAADKGPKDAAKIEMILRQQRELEANQLVLTANKDHKEGRFEDAINNYLKAIRLYEKSSAAEKRIITKINNSRIMLLRSYKSLANQIIKQAEKENSAELFTEAEGLLLKAQELSKKIKAP